MPDSITIIAASTCSNPSTFTITTTNVPKEIRCHEIPQIEATSEPIPSLQTQ